MGEELRELDLTDDRLEALLRYLECDRDWYSVKSELGGSLLQVYDIAPERVRLDSTTASSHKQSGLLYIGDCKMASMGTRTHIVSGKAHLI
jgi:hypothetical protein